MSWLLTLIILGVGFIQLPMLLDLLSSTTTGKRVSLLKTSHNILQGFVVATTFSVFVGVYAVYVIYHVPELWRQGVVTCLLHTLPITWLWLASLAHYLAAVCIRPSKQMLSDKSVPGFDHTCPFTMNCVWDGNFASFYLFITYVCMGMVYASITTWRPFYNAWISPLVSGQAASGFDSTSLVFIGASAILQAMAVFWVWQTALLLLDATTVEAIAQAQCAGVLKTLKACLHARKHTRFDRLLKPHLSLGLLYTSNIWLNKTQLKSE
eukprot:TRINITY_DN6846_c0_g2_i1.p1 TRINITY_DN6846_c0_g2~~TRINITY_DN6846_c0_g2_i1.p1  ORF type:complete len:266 (+),score=15.36 TRINITY_DN6846_c0_g2_i1:78-875(+)